MEDRDPFLDRPINPKVAGLMILLSVIAGIVLVLVKGCAV